MNKEEVLQKFEVIFRKVLENDSLEIGFEDSASSVEGWDSITNLYIVDEIEKEFSIKLSLDDIMNSQNIDDLCNVVVEKL